MKPNKDDQPGLTPGQLAAFLVLFAVWVTVCAVAFHKGVLA